MSRHSVCPLPTAAVSATKLATNQLQQFGDLQTAAFCTQKSIFILRKARLTRKITLNHEHHEFQIGSCLYANSNNGSTIALLNVSDCCFTIKGEPGQSYVYEIHCNYWQAVGPTHGMAGEAVVAWSWPCISILEPKLRIDGAVPPLPCMLS